jgi:hypothetical protein
VKISDSRFNVLVAELLSKYKLTSEYASQKQSGKTDDEIISDAVDCMGEALKEIGIEVSYTHVES